MQPRYTPVASSDADAPKPTSSSSGGGSHPSVNGTSAGKGSPSNQTSASQLSSQGSSPVRQVVYAAVCCLLWLVCSSTLILANKVILVDLGFKYPMAVSAMGMGFASVAAYIYCDVLKLVPAADFVDARFFLTKIFPVGAIQAMTLGIGNQLYLLLTVSFIEMSRASLPVCTMLALWIARVETPTNEVIKAVSLTAVGCAIAAYGEVHVSLAGAFFMTANLVMESTRLVMTQFLLRGVDLPSMQALKFIAPSATICLLFASAIQEYPRMVKAGSLAIPASHPGFFMLAASLGLIVNVLGVLIIKLSSATTLKVLAAVRGPVVVLLSVILFAEHVSKLEAVGYSLALAGFIWYNWAKSNQALQESKDSAPSKN